MSVSPILCVTVARWLARGILSAVGWLPFLNCAPAFPANGPHTAKHPREPFHTLSMIESAPLEIASLNRPASTSPHSRWTPLVEKSEQEASGNHAPNRCGSGSPQRGGALRSLASSGKACGWSYEAGGSVNFFRDSSVRVDDARGRLAPRV